MKFDNLVALVFFLSAAFASGITAAVIYYDMALLQTSLESVNFPIPHGENSTAYPLEDFQDILGITVYPLLGLKSSLIYLTYFLIFAMIVSMAMNAYMSYEKPVFFVVHIGFLIIASYFALILRNVYLELITNSFFNSMIQPFIVYHYLMTYLPHITFFTGLLFGAIAFINIIKPQAQLSQDLYYGGDY